MGWAVSLAGCGGAGDDETEPYTPEPGELPAGQVSDYAVGTVRRIDEGPVFVVRDAAGLYAMSAMCTHQGCTVEPGTDRLACPCHGSEFDLTGAVTQGPANEPLRHYAVYVDGSGRVTVRTSEPVDPSTRTAV
jgi:Rieske Fe-S protein